jgi:hypothetical protein
LGLFEVKLLGGRNGVIRRHQDAISTNSGLVLLRALISLQSHCIVNRKVKLSHTWPDDATAKRICSMGCDRGVYKRVEVEEDPTSQDIAENRQKQDWPR